MFLFIFLIISNISSCKSTVNPQDYQDDLKRSQKYSKIYINKARQEIILFHYNSSNKKYSHLKKSINFLNTGVKDVLSYEEKRDFRSFFKKIENAQFTKTNTFYSSSYLLTRECAGKFIALSSQKGEDILPNSNVECLLFS